MLFDYQGVNTCSSIWSCVHCHSYAAKALPQGISVPTSGMSKIQSPTLAGHCQSQLVVKQGQSVQERHRVLLGSQSVDISSSSDGREAVADALSPFTSFLQTSCTFRQETNV